MISDAWGGRDVRGCRPCHEISISGGINMGEKMSVAAERGIAAEDRGSYLWRTNMFVDTILGRLEKASLVVSCASLFIIMILVFLDASLRYLANSPLIVTADLVTLYLISAAFLPVLANTLRHGGHISVDIIAQLLPPRLYHILLGVALLLSSGVVGLMANEVYHLALESWTMNEQMVGIYPWPMWLGKAIVAFSLLMLTLRLFHIACTHCIAGILNIPEFAIPVAELNEIEEEGV